MSSHSYRGYDALGRVLGATQTIGSQSYSISNIVYDLAGHMLSERYPSGHTVSYGFDGAGRLNSFTGNLGGAQRNYSTGLSYSPFGGLTQEQFGTTPTRVYNKLFYNSRQQLAEILASTTGNDTGWDRGKVVNGYSSQCSGAGCNNTDNNGNLMRQDVYNPSGATFTQYYAYDSLNRLKSVREDNPNGPSNWQQAYSYDRYGNRSFDVASMWGGVYNNQATVVQNTTTNRMYGPGETEQNHPSIDYDAAGNQIKDYYTWNGTRTYDAENRMITANNGSTDVYTYDGDGRRVKRNINGTETWQVYGIGGELLAEYSSTNANPLSPQKECGYRNGQLLITATVTSSWGSPPLIHDNPLVPGQTTIQSRHITELREAINALRAHYNLPNYQWQKPTASGGTINNTVLISWEPIDEMRTALDQALGPPLGGYTAGLGQGQLILAIYIQELRDRLLAAWGVDLRWLVTDQLGTPRIIIDETGSLSGVSRHDYLPFGEELTTQGGRNPQQGYSASDGIRQKWIGKEQDSETGLDFFGARYYASTQGRFTGPDPLLSTGRPDDPQTWNRYSYSLNNPLSLVDPTGLFSFGTGLTDEQKKKITDAYNNLKAALSKLQQGSKAYKSIARSLARLGEPGKANGVVVTVGSVKFSEGADTDVNRINKGIVTIRFDEKTFANSRASDDAATLVMKVFMLPTPSNFTHTQDQWLLSQRRGSRTM